MRNGQCDAMSVFELASIDTLVVCSDRIEVQEKGVYVSDYDEIRPWKAVKPMCSYMTTPLKRRRKRSSSDKAKAKKNKLPVSFQFYVNNTVVEKSKLKSIQFTKEYHPAVGDKCICKHNLLIDDCNSFQNCSSSVTQVKNKLARSQNVLSYDVPSWRFIVNTKTYSYVDRCHPKDLTKVYNLSPRFNSSSNSNKSMQILDPAVFIDERLAMIHKAYESYKPNKEMYKVLKRLQELSFVDADMHSRLLSTSLINIPVADGESVENEDIENPKFINLRSDKLKLSIKTKTKKETKVKNVKRVTTKKKKKKKGIKHSKSSENKKLILPVPTKNTSHLKLPSITNTSKKVTNDKMLQSSVVYNGSIVSQITLDKKPSDSNITYRTSELYLPTLNYGNYTEFYLPKDSVIHKSNIKLPPIVRCKWQRAFHEPLSPSTSSVLL